MAFQILALSGGGYLGLFTACIIESIEQAIGEPIGRRFDLIAGTSIGGIIALALAGEVPAAQIAAEFSAKGKNIFSDRPRPKHTLGTVRDISRFAVSAKYSSNELRSVIQSFLGDRLFGEVEHRVLVPAVNMTKGSVQMFKTPHHETFRTDYRRRMTDIAMATSAAPTYFPLASIDDSLFVDGGLFANAPDLCALHEATHFLGQRAEDVRILSIGTTTSKFSMAHATGSDLGLYQWIKDGRLFSTMIAAQQQLVGYLMQHQLGDRYLRIDCPQSREQEAELGLDIATDDASRTIRGMAEGTYQSISANAFFQTMLHHRPATPKFFHGPRAGSRM